MPPNRAPANYQQKRPRAPIDVPKVDPARKPNVFQDLKPTKVEEPEPTPPARPANPGGAGELHSSDVQIKDPNQDVFGGGKKDNKFNGIKFMGSQIASFNDIPTLNSKIVPGRRPKLPSINKIGGPGQLISKIFNPNVSVPSF